MAEIIKPVVFGKPNLKLAGVCWNTWVHRIGEPYDIPAMALYDNLPRAGRPLAGA